MKQRCSEGTMTTCCGVDKNMVPKCVCVVNKKKQVDKKNMFVFLFLFCFVLYFTLSFSSDVN